MNRRDVIDMLSGLLRDELVVCNIGHPSQELFYSGDRPRNFYMLGSMGLASSIGLGLALSTPRRVVVIEGDGAVLMNLGSLATIGANQPRNYVLLIVDNEAYGSTGFQPTFTGRGVDLARVAEGCGIRRVRRLAAPAETAAALAEALQSGDGPWCLVVKTTRAPPRPMSPIPLAPVAIRDRFMEALRE